MAQSSPGLSFDLLQQRKEEAVREIVHDLECFSEVATNFRIRKNRKLKQLIFRPWQSIYRSQSCWQTQIFALMRFLSMTYTGLSLIYISPVH